MSEVVLVAERRTQTGTRPAGRFRRDGLLPAVVYGLGAEPVPVVVPVRELQQILHGEAGANTLITLEVDGSAQLTLARQIQRDPLRGQLVHVDFVRVRADQAVSAEVPLHLTGIAAGVDEGGMLEQQLFSVRVQAKPADIPNAFEYDVSALFIGGQVHVGDLALPPGVELMHESDELVAAVAAPRAVEVAEEAEGEEGEAGAEAADAEADATESDEGGGEE
jgi:large subunit ribosomal protein L25